MKILERLICGFVLVVATPVFMLLGVLMAWISFFEEGGRGE